MQLPYDLLRVDLGEGGYIQKILVLLDYTCLRNLSHRENQGLSKGVGLGTPFSGVYKKLSLWTRKKSRNFLARGFI